MPSGHLDRPQRLARRTFAAVRAEGVAGVISTIRHGFRWRQRRAKRWFRSKRDRMAARIPSRLLSVPSSGGVSLEPTSGVTVERPLVTVVITTLNRSELLPVALRSIQLQDLADWECVIVDDGSTDDTVAVAQRFVEADPRFRVLSHDSNRGLSAARNTGIAAAVSPFVCFLDDDDFLFEGSLRARLSALQAAPLDIAASYCDWLGTDPEVGLELFAPQRTPVRRGLFAFTSLRSGPPCIATSPLLRRDVLVSVGGFDETMSRGEDAELWQRILRLGYRFVDAEHLGVAYRRSPGSMVLGAPESQLETLVAIDAASDEPAVDVEGHGPLPTTAPLSALTPDSLRAPQRYRYLAMISQHDVSGAVELGRSLVPEAVRWEIDPAVLSRELTSYVIARGVIRDSRAQFDAASRVQRLVDGLLPQPFQNWAPISAPYSWVESRQRRAEELAGRPQIVPAGSAHLDGRIVLIAEAEYHVDEVGPLARELERRGLSTAFMLSPRTAENTVRALGRYTDTVVEFDVERAGQLAAVFVLNDWGPARQLLERANEAGVPTFAKVEGVQDFDDVDTDQDRRAYRTARTVLGQGVNDQQSLPDCDVHIIGSSRLERIWLDDPVEPTDSVLINLNFTYRVLTQHRNDWLSSVRTAVNSAAVPALISTHPAERSRRIGLPVATKPFRHEITRAGVLVSRFSTVPFEAMARGVPFVYHNPHGERVPTFARPDGAFPITRSAEELSDSLVDALSANDHGGRDRWAEFFLRQVDVVPGVRSEERAAAVIVSSLC